MSSKMGKCQRVVPPDRLRFRWTLCCAFHIVIHNVRIFQSCLFVGEAEVRSWINLTVSPRSSIGQDILIILWPRISMQKGFRMSLSRSPRYLFLTLNAPATWTLTITHFLMPARFSDRFPCPHFAHLPSLKNTFYSRDFTLTCHCLMSMLMNLKGEFNLRPEKF